MMFKHDESDLQIFTVDGATITGATGVNLASLVGGGRNVCFLKGVYIDQPPLGSAGLFQLNIDIYTGISKSGGLMKSIQMDSTFAKAVYIPLGLYMTRIYTDAFDPVYFTFMFYPTIE